MRSMRLLQGRFSLIFCAVAVFISPALAQQGGKYGLSDVTATLDPDEKLAPGTSLLWSPTAQAAWDQMKAYHHVDAIELEPHTHLADVLNRFVWDDAATLPDGTIIFGGDDSEDRRKEIRAALLKRVGPNAAAMIGPFQPPGPLDEKTTRIGSALFVSCLSHNPKFPVTFAPSTGPFRFSNAASVEVRGFGCQGAEAGRYFDAVEVLADDLNGAYVIKFTFFSGEKGRPEFMLVATRPRLESLGEAITWMREAINKPLPADQSVKHNNQWWRWHHQLTPSDRFWMPLLQTTLSCDYGELIGRTYLRQRHANGWQTFWKIREAQQLVSFRLDEHGALAQSVFKVPADFLSVGGAPSSGPEPPAWQKLPLLPRRYLLNSPFVVSLWMKGAEWPYLACWVDSEALVKRK